MSLFHWHEESRILRELMERLERVECLQRRILHRLERTTPTHIAFQEITMLDAVAGNTLVYTGTLSPSGSAFPAGTTFSVVSSDPTVSPTVDETGLIVTIPLPSTFVDDPANPLTITYSTGDFTPSPAGSPSSLTATITPTVPVSATPTPTSISFNQTT